MPHPTAQQFDTIRCKHCEAIVSLTPRAAIVGRTPLRCVACGVITVVWPAQPAAQQVYTTSERVAALADA